MTEEWKPIMGFRGLYEISNFGRVKSLARSFNFLYLKKNIKEKILTPQKLSNGSLGILLHSYQKRKRHQISRLVAYHFLDNPKLLFFVRHKDGDKSNNKVSNLEWITNKELYKNRKKRKKITNEPCNNN